MLWKCCTQYTSKFGNLSSGHKTGKGRFKFQSQRKTMPKNAQISTQLHSSLTLVKQCSKFSKPGFSNTRTVNFQMFNLEIANICWIIEKARVPEKHLFLLYWLCQSLWLRGSPETVENSEGEGNTRPPDLPLETSVCRSGSNSQNWTWNNRLIPNRKRSTSRLYIVTLLI